MWTPYLVLATGLFVTAVATSLVQRQVTLDERQRFEQDTDHLAEVLLTRLNAYEDSLHALVGLFHVSEEVDARRFGDFVSQLRIDRHPGLRALAHAERVGRGDLSALVARMREEGFVDFAPWPDVPNGHAHHPITWAAPLTGVNRAALGFDLSTEPTAARALQRSCSTGEAAMTASIELPTAPDPDRRTGFLMMLPVFGEPGRHGCDEAEGFVLGVIVSEVFFNSVVDELPEGQLKFAIRSAATGETLFGPSEPRPGQTRFRGNRELEVGGRAWTVSTWPGTAFDLLSPRTLVPAALVTGVLVSVLLFGLVLSESKARDRAERAAAELYHSEDALQRANQAKDEFLAMLGHELRNPLSAVKMALDILRHATIDDPDARAALDVADRQMRHQTRLVDDLLDVSRVSRGKIALKPQRVDLRDVVMDAVAGVEGSDHGQAHGLTVDRPARPVCVDGDPTRLEQVVTNLLLNASKYSPRGTRIHVVVATEGEHAVIRVRDEGVGIDPDQLERIFDLFAQVDTSLDRSAGGLGIGLTLVKRLVELHGGEVRAHSEGQGKGSEFMVSLPLAEAPGEGDAYGAHGEEGGADPLRILLVEDNEDARLMLSSLLERQGHQVETAADGESGVQAAMEIHPDVALVDIGLPAMDGHEVARRIRSRWGSEAPVLISISGYGQPADHERSRQAGFVQHLVKPVDPAALRSLLSRVRPRTPRAYGVS
jgi:signal transduction histidine kinase/ActR/RegA family two-component response regulator